MPHDGDLFDLIISMKSDIEQIKIKLENPIILLNTKTISAFVIAIVLSFAAGKINI